MCAFNKLHLRMCVGGVESCLSGVLLKNAAGCEEELKNISSTTKEYLAVCRLVKNHTRTFAHWCKKYGRGRGTTTTTIAIAAAIATVTATVPTVRALYIFWSSQKVTI